eukprot:PLAT12510.6.p1 GENE.PLAT12510.6~~PLAT12510.6.p1  ORF type:complete len:506 (+),score=183.66 PLAT12510.6:200-1519(+)
MGAGQLASGCTAAELPAGQLNGSLLVVSQIACAFETKAEVAMLAGASAVLLARGKPGPVGDEAFIFSGQPVAALTLPVVAVEAASTRGVADGSAALLTSGDENPWEELRTSVVFSLIFQVVCSALAAANALLAARKQLQFMAVQGFKLSVTQSCLLLELVVNAERAVYFALDPLLSRRQLNFFWANVLLSVAQPFALATTVLITFYWAALLQRAGASRGRLIRWKKPLIYASALVFAFEVLSSAAIGAYLADQPPWDVLLVLKSIVFLVITAVVAILFLLTARSVLQTLRGTGGSARRGGAGGKGNAQKRSLRRMTLWITLSALFMLLQCCGMLLVAVPAIYWQPQGQQAVWALLALASLATSSAQLAAFSKPSADKSRGRAGRRGDGKASAAATRKSKRKVGGREVEMAYRSPTKGSDVATVSAAGASSTDTALPSAD